MTCHLSVQPTPPITTTFSYRSLRRINRAAFCHDILRSKLFGSIIEDADEYADLFDAEVKYVLDIHVPLRTGHRRCSQHNSCNLSDEAGKVEKLRRRLERRYRRTGIQSDKQSYVSGCSSARESILKSRADYIKAELDEVSGDIGATWRMAQRLLHSKHKAVFDNESVRSLCQLSASFLSTRTTTSATIFPWHYSQ